MMLTNKTISVAKTRNGLGIFTTTKRKKGERVLHIRGEVMNWQVSKSKGQKFLSNTIRFGEDDYLSPHGELGELINHSCEPNCRLLKERGRLYLETIRPVKAGEELFFDYSTTIADDDVWTMRCNCGTSSCRSVVGKFSELPEKLQKKYKQKQVVPGFIVEINDSLKD